jgi:hypothetical protein
MIRKGIRSRTVGLEDLAMGDDSVHWSERVPDRSAICPRRQAEGSDLRKRLLNEMDNLPSRTRRMLEMMYFSEGRRTFSDLAKVFGVSRERCRQVCARGLELLREALEDQWEKILGVDSAFIGMDAEEAGVALRLELYPEPARAEMPWPGAGPDLELREPQRSPAA